MLNSLHIENMAVIKNCDINFSPGFTSLTGETGAGKSIIIDSIALLCGSRSDRSVIRTGEDKALVSGFFTDVSADIEELIKNADVPLTDGEAMLTRQLSADGRSVCKINGRQLPLSIYKEIASLLVNIHGQQDNWSLLKESCHLALLDKYASTEKLLSGYKLAYHEYCEKRDELDKIISDSERDREQKDVLEHRLKELSSAKLKAGEEEKLLVERKRLQNAEKIDKQTGLVYRAIKGGDKVNAIYLLDRSITALRALSDVSEEYSALAERLENAKYEIEDVADCTTAVSGGFDGDPSQLLTDLESRLFKLDALKKKYRKDTPELIELLEETKLRLANLENSDGDIDLAKKELATAKSKCVKLADELSEMRKRSATDLSERICSELAFLDMPNVRFVVCVENNARELSPEGTDVVRFMLAGASGEPPRPLSKIASGGELSRVMLAVKSVFAEADEVATVIYDEVDAGVSGKTARKIGIKLKNTAKRSQVFCVTHSAQIASLSDTHLVVYKQLDGELYSTSVRELNTSERVEELSRILGGINITEAQRKAAIDLLDPKNDNL